MLALATFAALVILLCAIGRRHSHQQRHGYRIQSSPIRCRQRRKPDWVRRKIIHLKALLPDEGCRHIADVFNRRHGNGQDIRVGKTYVSYVIRHNQYQILLQRRYLRRRRPLSVPLHQTWALDLSGKTDTAARTHMMLAIVEHASRACLLLERCRQRSSAALLLQLCATIRQHGLPRCLRTDNEGIFTSRLFRFGLICLGIRHQRTHPGCPWENGRVERFFGTLKRKLDRWNVPDACALDASLYQFRLWYNHVRPHQHLDGRTPAEAFTGNTKAPKEITWFQAWDGMLAGYYLRR